MYFYQIGYSDWESCPTYVLCHTTLYSQVQFENILCECYYESNKIEEVKHNKWVSEDKDITPENIDLYTYEPRVDNLFNNVYTMLLEKYRFTDLIFDANFIPSSTEPIIPNEKRGRKYDTNIDSELKKLRNYFEHIGMRDDKINDIIQNEKPST